MLHFILSLLIVVADIFAILKITQSSVPVEHKVIWIVIILLLPVLGFIAWYIVGPGDKTVRLKY
ncbi:hypothetical protein BegalDRAFT_0468 [Beggiatoa alba B18LD]|uniref:Cardiolipin synthase N-terminal domain-containing protein n=1 Tax=Beggiatoa alba B18LD TaxID=395493 RepID=I3CCP4_9GAMM|nr:PLDc N-terminal domain-containing protein [Beggiatoa alba]EIJ41387.1 hypothetical protein BegalDRAFT_0468 [Beggiatoa alba B18LD]